MAHVVTNPLNPLFHSIVAGRLKRKSAVRVPLAGPAGSFEAETPHAGILFVHDGVKCRRILDDCLRIPNQTKIHLLIFKAEWQRYQVFTKAATGQTPKWTAGKLQFLEFPTQLRKSPGASSMKDAYAFLAFLETVKFARDQQIDWFFNIEWDCLFHGAGWLDALWEEHVTFCQGTVCSGTPCVWDADRYVQKSRVFYENVVRWAAETIDVTGTPCVMKTLQAGPPRVYPNGALAWYRTDIAVEGFLQGVEILDDGFTARKFAPRLQAYVDAHLGYDFYFGAWLALKYGDQVTTHIGRLAGAYSGWEDEMFKEKERVEMVESGAKVAIHQYKH